NDFFIGPLFHFFSSRRADNVQTRLARGVVMSIATNHGTSERPQPTILETELDSICLTLTQMAHRLNRAPLLDHMTGAERAELAAAVERVEKRVLKLGG